MTFARIVAPIAFVVMVGACDDTPPDPRQKVDDAVSAMRHGETERALAIATEGSRRSHRQGNLHWAARFDLLRAEIVLGRSDSGDLRTAELLIADARQTADSDDSIRPRWHYLRGYAAYKRAAYEDAVAPLEAAFAGAREASLPDVAVEARNLQGRVYLALQDAPEGERRFVDALALARNTGDRFLTATAHLNLAYVCLQTRRYDEAITHSEETRILARAAGSALMDAVAGGNLAVAWFEIGDLVRALEARLEANSVLRRAGLRQYVSQGLGHLGQIQLTLGDSAAARASLRDAVSIARQLGTPGEIGTWAVELSHALIDSGDTVEAAEWIEVARAGYRATGDSAGLARTDIAEGDLAAALGDDSRATACYEAVAKEFPDDPKLAWKAHAGLADAARRAGRLDAARAHYARSVAAIEAGRDELVRLESRLGFLTRTIRTYQDHVALLLDMRLDDEALRAIESSRAQTLLDGSDSARSRRLDVGGLIEAARRHDVAMLSFWISPRGSFVWLFTPTGARRVPIEGADRIADLARKYRAIIELGWRDPIATERSAGHELYRLLVAPIRDFLPPGARVIVVPDGPLHMLNLETVIVDGNRRRYLIEDYTLVVAPALAPLTDDPSQRDGSVPSMLLVGDPVAGDPGFPRLPYASRELDAVAARLSEFPVDVLRGAEATRDAVLRRPIEAYTWLHFTAHAQSVSGNPLDSAVILSPDPGGAKLYARDVLERRLGAGLVTLSACRGAGSRLYSGEGLVGFAWAFMRAGAPRVIAGLWDVNDRSTVLLMDEMYNRIAGGDPAATALRAAKLKLLESESTMAKPYYWAPFQLFSRTARP